MCAEHHKRAWCRGQLGEGFVVVDGDAKLLSRISGKAVDDDLTEPEEVCICQKDGTQPAAPYPATEE